MFLLGEFVFCLKIDHFLKQQSNKYFLLFYFKYLPNKEIVKQLSDNMNDFNVINKNLDACGISAEKKNRIYSVLAAILNLGNIKFEKCDSNDDKCFVPHESQAILNNVAVLLGMNKIDLEDVLTNRTISVLNSEIRYIIFKCTVIFSIEEGLI